jgi:MFS family permease
MGNDNGTVKTGAYAVLKIKDFRAFISARFTLTFAIQMQSVIVGWQVYELTKDPFALGLIGLTEAIPFLCIAMFAGHVADIADRRKIILISNFVFFLCSTTLFLFNFQFSYIFRTIGVLPIYIVIFFTGLARGFIYPPQMGLMAQIVPKELYPNSSTWNSLLFHLALILGPAVGGLIYGFFNPNVAYFTVMLFASISWLLFYMVKKQPIPVQKVKESLFKSLHTGIHFVFHHQILLGAMALDMFAVLFGGAVAMLPVFADVILHVGPKGLGFLRAAPAAGAICMSLFLAYHPPLQNTGKKLLAAAGGFGLCIIFFAISKNFYLSLLLLALSGVCDNMSVVIRQTIMQLYTPDEMRGRVAAVNSIFIGSSNEIGAFESGLAARLLTLIPSVIFGGSMTLIIVGLTGRIAPMLRKLSITKD